jgi:hypothetical protein
VYREFSAARVCAVFRAAAPVPNERVIEAGGGGAARRVLIRCAHTRMTCRESIVVFQARRQGHVRQIREHRAKLRPQVVTLKVWGVEDGLVGVWPAPAIMNDERKDAADTAVAVPTSSTKRAIAFIQSGRPTETIRQDQDHVRVRESELASCLWFFRWGSSDCG